MRRGWAVCPSCAAVVADVGTHARACSAVAAWVAQVAATTAPEVGDGPGWDGTPVLAAPDAPDPAAQVTAAAQRAKATAARAAITTRAIPTLDAYLDLTAPTAAQVAAQVRALTTIVRGLAVAVRALIRLTTRALDTNDQEA